DRGAVVERVPREPGGGTRRRPCGRARLLGRRRPRGGRLRGALRARRPAPRQGARTVIEFLALPFVACLVLTAIHVYLGLHVRALALLYAVLGALLWAVRRPLLLISFDPDGAARRHAVRAWDFVFYASFGLVVTSSVRVAGVLLVFSYLVVPATVAALLTDSVRGRLLLGWGVGVGVSAGGLFASYVWDLPTGATVVVTFGASLAGVALARAARGLGCAVRTRGAAALRLL